LFLSLFFEIFIVVLCSFLLKVLNRGGFYLLIKKGCLLTWLRKSVGNILLRFENIGEINKGGIGLKRDLRKSEKIGVCGSYLLVSIGGGRNGFG